MTTEDDDKRTRQRRYEILCEDGAVFGLTPRESAELAELEKEFGPSGLSQDMRS